jgi:hypothetical protein
LQGGERVRVALVLETLRFLGRTGIRPRRGGPYTEYAEWSNDPWIKEGKSPEYPGFPLVTPLSGVTRYAVPILTASDPMQAPTYGFRIMRMLDKITSNILTL